MNSKFVLVVIAFACLAGVALSASTKQERKCAKPKDPKMCDTCQAVVDTMKRSGYMGEVQQQLDMLCSMVPDQTKSSDCTSLMNEFVHTMETKNPMEVCTKIKMCP